MMVGDGICKPEVRRKKTLPRLEMETLPLQRASVFNPNRATFFFFFFFRNCRQKSRMPLMDKNGANVFLWRGIECKVEKTLEGSESRGCKLKCLKVGK